MKVRVDPGGMLQVDVPALRQLGPGTGLAERVSLATDQTLEVDYSPKESCGSATVSSSPQVRRRIRSSFGCAARWVLTVILNSAS